MGLPDKYKGATAGPWIANPEGNEDVLDADRKLIASAYHGLTPEKRLDPSTQPRAEANGRLIADAPMLACRVAELEKLVGDLWRFTENVSDVAPDRHERFFALRVRVRESLAASPLAACAANELPAEAGKLSEVVNA